MMSFHALRLTIPFQIALVLLLSGCVGEGKPESTPPGDDVETLTAVTQDPAGNALARFDLDEAVHKTLWANGTYQVQEHFFPVYWVPGNAGLVPPPGIRILDISSEVPRGVPVRVIAEVNAEVTDGDVDLWINAPFNEVWSGTWDTPQGGFSRIELRFVHTTDDPVGVGLFYDEVDPSVEFPYTLRVDILAEPQLVLSAVGAAIDVPMDEAKLLVTVEETEPDSALLVWEPDFELLGRFGLKEGTTEVPIPTSGEHLLLLTQGTGDAVVSVEGVTEAPRLRAAQQEVVEFVGEAPSSPVSWTFEAERAPIQMGFFGESGTVATDFTGSLSSPKGKLLDVQFEGGPWVRPFMGFGIGEWTLMGADGLVKGAYEANVAFAQAAGPDPIHYGHFIVYMAAP